MIPAEQHLAGLRRSCGFAGCLTESLALNSRHELLCWHPVQICFELLLIIVLCLLSTFKELMCCRRGKAALLEDKVAKLEKLVRKGKSITQETVASRQALARAPSHRCSTVLIQTALRSYT